MPRYRFADFLLSPRRRTLVRGGRELRLIPRYFDLLVFLVEHRHEAVHRRDIFDRVWNDVIVSDSALSQAIRTLRRTLGDDIREPLYIRTVSRHGYRFVFADVIEEQDDDTWPSADGTRGPADEPVESAADTVDRLLERLTRKPASGPEEEDARDAAERLHALGTSEALKHLGVRPGHARARALLRDTRWDVAGSGPVPFIGQPGTLAAAAALVRLRLRRAARVAAVRGLAAIAGGGGAGAIAGALGGLLLVAAPGSHAPVAVAAVLAVVGACCGAFGAAGVGSGLSIAETIARSERAPALAVGGAIGGAIVGYTAQWLSRWSLEALVGMHVSVGGGLEGLVLGGAAGLGYACATRRVEDGLATPRGRDRWRAVALTAAASAAGALALTVGGRPLVGGTVHAVAQAATGSQAVLTPLGRFIGDPDFGPITRALIGTAEGGLFGFGLAMGLTRRPLRGT